MARAVAVLRATGRAYVRFALAEPGLFAVAFAAPVLPDEADPATPPETACLVQPTPTSSWARPSTS